MTVFRVRLAPGPEAPRMGREVSGLSLGLAFPDLRRGGCGRPGGLFER